MKFDINNPAFMQAAGNTPKALFAKMIFSTPYESGEYLEISANGDIVMIITFNGITKQYQYSDSAVFVLEYDPGTPIIIKGDITKIDGYHWPRLCTYFNIMNCPNLEELYFYSYQGDFINLTNNIALNKCQFYRCDIKTCSFNSSDLSGCGFWNCASLNSVDISKSPNVEVEAWATVNNNNLRNIKARAINDGGVTSISSLLASTTVTDGVLFLQTGDSHNTQAAEAAIAKGWTVEYVDA